MWRDAVEVVLGDGSACTIVAIHGYGADPEGLSRMFVGMPLNAVVVLPRGPEPQGKGTRWFMSSRDVDVATYSEAIGRAAERLAGGLKAGVPGDRSKKKPIVTGFSQGGMLSWTLAAQHTDLVASAFPIGGLLPESLLPTTTPGVPVQAFHGEGDQVVPHDQDARSVKQVVEKGWTAKLHSYPGVPHTITPRMHRDLTRALSEACK